MSNAIQIFPQVTEALVIDAISSEKDNVRLKNWAERLIRLEHGENDFGYFLLYIWAAFLVN